MIDKTELLLTQYQVLSSELEEVKRDYCEAVVHFLSTGKTVMPERDMAREYFEDFVEGYETTKQIDMFKGEK